MRDNKVQQLCETGIFAALIFVATVLLKIPTPFGYTHLGDCLLFLSVLMLGWKRGACAGALGEAMADLIGGYAVWIVPTLIAKSLMAAIMGLVLERMLKNSRGRMGWILGAVLGGAFQVAVYTITRVFLYGPAVAISRIPFVSGQTLVGIVLAFILTEALQKTSLRSRFCYTTDAVADAAAER